MLVRVAGFCNSLLGGSTLERFVPNVKMLHTPVEPTGLCFVSIKKGKPGEPLEIGKRIAQIVGDLEADIKLNLIAISSPLARALIGKHAGDSVVLEAPGGTREYEIVEVAYLG